ncbi:uncharacterized protein LOC129314403 [Prosopis cineraria]|uniref:uncharacterized protein LOC129314403 n=1 Tax=Prosopis cineraria TaxID=364024 RepID=UPI00240FC30A|nr:uncharacterized protein LOC129314403 [Prosopis cineraria]
METEAKISMSNWNSQTNWTIASGSLQDCITFESSLSLANEGGDEVGATTVDSTLKSSLILCPSSADSGPCEIMISFAQKHEVLQVYVRSTARVYEIYCEPDVQSSNEYLCTVRCGIAARDGEVLHALNVEEVVSSHVKGFNKELSEENNRSEDDWVDVKIPDSSLLDGGNHGLHTKSCINSAKSSQDLFEATAEISDVNPCMSVTLRLLSLQNKGCVCIDEIYVFADPVALADSERQESNAENSSGSSLMAMFLPTLMQLSKTTALSHIHEEHPPVTKEKQYFPEVDLGKSCPCDSVINIQLEGRASKTDHQEGELQKVNEDSGGPSQSDLLLQDAPFDSNLMTTSQADKMENNQSETPSKAAKIESNYCDLPSEATTIEKNHGDSLGVNVAKALEQLVSRMDRMEAICLGFQEKMLMPISSIEARLQQVEQQLETLTIKLHNSGLPPCSRIYAPDGSCIQSDANSFGNCHGNKVTGGLKPDKNGSHIEVLCVSPDDMSDSANATQLHPGLLVTAPEFLDAEDEEESITSGLEATSNDKQRQHLSIDDAVASALAGFLSSVSSETPRYTKSLVVRAPEFINEDDQETNDASPRTSYEMENNDDSTHLKDSKRINCTQESTSHSVHPERGEKVNRDPNDEASEGFAREAEEYGQHNAAEDDQKEVGLEAGVLAEHNAGTSFEHTVEDKKSRNTSGQIDDGLPSTSDIPKPCQTDSDPSASTEGEVCVSTDHTDTIATKVPKKASHEDIIENILGFSRSSSVVDFKTSLLDVKFISQEHHVTKPLLEALVHTPEKSFQDHHVGGNSDELPIDEQFKTNDNLSLAELNNLIDVAEHVNPATDGHFSVDKDYCALINVPVEVEGDNLQDDRKRKRKEDEIASSSLI